MVVKNDLISKKKRRLFVLCCVRITVRPLLYDYDQKTYYYNSNKAYNEMMIVLKSSVSL